MLIVLVALNGDALQAWFFRLSKLALAYRLTVCTEFLTANDSSALRKTNEVNCGSKNRRHTDNSHDRGLVWMPYCTINGKNDKPNDDQQTGYQISFDSQKGLSRTT